MTSVFFLSFFQSLAFEKNLYPHTRPITHPDRSYVSSQHGARVIRSCVSYFLFFFFQSLAFEKNLYPHTRPITLTGVM